MKKIFQSVMLLLFAGMMCLSVNAQVNVGSVDDPHDGSVLDLSKASNLGLLLPRVSLNDVSVWQLEGNSANGTGMMVYNIKEDIVGGSGSGVYVWDGAAWAPVKSTVTADVKVTGFTVTPDVTSVDVYVGGSQKFTVADFLPPLASYQSVSWRLSDSQGHTQILTPTAMECTVKGVSIGDAVLNIVSLDGNVSKRVNIHVKACISAPAAPAGILFSKATGIKLDESITATATPEVTTGGAKPTKYNWTIPSANFDIVGDATARQITLKAKAAASSITTAIKVNAENTCGTSNNYENTTAVNILNCSEVPAQPGVINISPATVVAGNTFTASVTNVPGVTYTWNVPSGLSIQSGQGSYSVVYKTSTATTIASGAITVTPSNACGNGTVRASTTEVSVCAVPAQPGDINISPATVIPGNTFTASVTNVSGVTYTWNVPSGLSIQSGQGTNAVVYKTSTAMTIASGAITVTPSNSCGSGAVRASTTVVTVTSCPGYLITNGAFEGGPSIVASGLTVSEVLALYNTNSKDLCVSPDLGAGRSWYDVSATNFCSTTVHYFGGNWNDGYNNWRLPNIAELANMQAIKGSIPNLAASSHYWSSLVSSEDSAEYAALWLFNGSGNSSYTYKTAKHGDIYTRCVRTIY